MCCATKVIHVEVHTLQDYWRDRDPSCCQATPDSVLLGTTVDLQSVHLDMNYLRSAAHFTSRLFFLLRGLRPSLPEIFLQMKQSGLTTSLDTNDDPENLGLLTLRMF